MKLTVKSVLLLLSSFLLQPKLGAMNGLTSEARKEAFKKIQQRVMLANSKRNMTGEKARLSQL